jgi:hypothetical protein
MKLKILYTLSFIVSTIMIMLSSSCNTNNSNKKIPVIPPQNQSNIKQIKKAASTYQDTLTIYNPAAVFYHPDSMQLVKIKAQSDTAFYEASMHEYFYQMRTARITMQKTWPRLSIIDSKKYRFLLFVKKDGTKQCVDLDKKNDPFGLLVFNTKKDAQVVDMMNVETYIWFYLKE